MTFTERIARHGKIQPFAIGPPMASSLRVARLSESRSPKARRLKP